MTIEQFKFLIHKRCYDLPKVKGTPIVMFIEISHPSTGHSIISSGIRFVPEKPSEHGQYKEICMGEELEKFPKDTSLSDVINTLFDGVRDQIEKVNNK